MSGSITINSNISSLNAQRRLSSGTKALSETFSRLSSGLRINRASDDAAGLAISHSLRTDQRIFNQGVRNLSDGVSLVSIADGALTELSNVMVRLAELAEQSTNGSLTNQQRKALDKEAQSLKAEYFRIAQSTVFNGRKLLAGDFGELRLQAGYGEQGGIVSDLGGAVGTGSFTESVSSAVGYATSNNAFGDLNGDGIQDMVTSHFGSNLVNVLIGAGDGTFTAFATLATGTGPSAIALGDVDNDGILDIVTTSSTAGVLSVMLGNGDGSFSSRSSFATGANPNSVMLGDLNGDGNTDVVATDSANRITIMLGSGGGSFSQHTSFLIGANARVHGLADLNGDDILDIVASGQSGLDGVVRILLGNADGSFNAPRSYLFGQQISRICLGDVNGDSVMDFIALDSTGGQSRAFIGQGDGTFSGKSIGVSGIGLSGTLGDVNGDGVLDFAANVTSFPTRTTIFLGRGDGSFAAGTSFEVGGGFSGAHLSDLDGDGVLDFVSTDGSAIYARLGDSTGGVGPLLDFSLSTQADARQALPVFKRKLAQLAAHRGQIGAMEARINTALNTLSGAVENVAAAASQITDADAAVEAAALVRNQILQQAGVAVLAQANQQPTITLKLLQSGLSDR